MYIKWKERSNFTANVQSQNEDDERSQQFHSYCAGSKMKCWVLNWIPEKCRRSPHYNKTKKYFQCFRMFVLFKGTENILWILYNGNAPWISETCLQYDTNSFHGIANNSKIYQEFSNEFPFTLKAFSFDWFSNKLKKFDSLPNWP